MSCLNCPSVTVFPGMVVLYGISSPANRYPTTVTSPWDGVVGAEVDGRLGARLRLGIKEWEWIYWSLRMVHYHSFSLSVTGKATRELMQVYIMDNFNFILEYVWMMKVYPTCKGLIRWRGREPEVACPLRMTLSVTWVGRWVEACSSCLCLTDLSGCGDKRKTKVKKTIYNHKSAH